MKRRTGLFFSFPLLFIRWDWFFQRGLKLFRGYSAECFWLFCLYNTSISSRTIRHEKVHAKQQWLFTPILYYLITGIAGAFYLIKYRKYKEYVKLAYYSLPFEKWAYNKSGQPNHCEACIKILLAQGFKNDKH